MSTDLMEAFGSYLLLRPLGRGGMGVVYVARSQDELHPIVALKRMRADADVPTFRERFWHECELALRLRHPHVVETLEAGEIDGHHFVASSLVRGQSAAAIAHRLHQSAEGMPVVGVVRVLADVLAALRYVHSATEPDGRSLELVHRDVTPGNVLVGYDGRSYLADFGLARSLLTDPLGLTKEGMLLGTPRYMALELVRGERASVRSDLYAVGALAYTLLSGRGPYPGNARQVLEAMFAGPPVPLARLRPDVPLGLRTFVEHLMARRAADRPASAEAAIAGLEAVVHEARLGLDHARLGTWLSGLFTDERTQTERQRARDLLTRPTTAPARAGTRVLPAVQDPFTGDDRLPTFHPEASLGTQLDGVPALGGVEPETDRGPAIPPSIDPLGDLPTLAPALEPPTAEAVGPTAPRPTRPPEVRVQGVDAVQPARVTPSSGAEPVPVAPPVRRAYLTSAIGIVAVGVVAAVVGATAMRMSVPSSNAEVIALSERLGVAQARLQQAAAQPRRAALSAKLDAARRRLENGDAVAARALVEEVEAALAPR